MTEFRKSKTFKQKNDECYKNALIGSFFSSDLGALAEAYYSAANILVDQTKHHQSNSLVYPICFLYRHFIEIALKNIIFKYQKLGYDVKRYGLRNREIHNLDLLLDTVVKLTKEEDESKYPVNIIEIIHEFNKYDFGSQTFRYTSDKKGNQFMPKHDCIGLGTLQDNMSKVEGWLTGHGIDLMEKLNIKHEIEKECADEDTNL